MAYEKLYDMLHATPLAPASVADAPPAQIERMVGQLEVSPARRPDDLILQPEDLAGVARVGVSRPGDLVLLPEDLEG